MQKERMFNAEYRDKITTFSRFEQKNLRIKEKTTNFANDNASRAVVLTHQPSLISPHKDSHGGH